jgi:hypothetical protein
MFFSALAAPDREWCAPKTIAADIPISCILEPIPKPAVSQMLWDPVGLAVILNEFFFERFDAYEPSCDGLIHEWRVASPAMSPLGAFLCDQGCVNFLRQRKFFTCKR